MPRYSTFLTALAIFALAVFAPTTFAGHGGKLPFNGDIEKQQQIAKMSGKGAVYYFTAEW